jgi:RimJ/RimL family protein N-acetyltransferase
MSSETMLHTTTASILRSSSPRRLQLSPVTLDDAAALNRWKNDEELQLMSSDTFAPESLEGTRARLERWLASDPDEIVHFAIRLVDAPGMVGFCHLAEVDRQNQSCKVGIVLGERQLWGQGLGSEAVMALVEQAFARQLTRVGAEVYSSNVRSVRMLERVGFEREGVRRRSVRRRGAWEDELLYALLAPER